MNTESLHASFLGVDMSKASFIARLVSSTKVHSAPFINEPTGWAQLDGWLGRHHCKHVLAGLEPTGPYAAGLLWHLHCKGHTVCLINARHLKHYGRSLGRKVKTDHTDAALIADYLRANAAHLRPWQPPTQETLVLQAMVRRRQQVLGLLQAERNRTEGVTQPLIKASLQRQIGHLKTEVARLDQALERHVLQHHALQHSIRLLCTIPGIGFAVAVAILAEVPALSAFARARDLAAFAGLTPSVIQSGTSVHRRGRLTKEGSALLRKMLYMAALQAIKRPTNALHRCYQHFIERGKSKMCAIGALMHKLIRIAFGVLKHGQPFVENFAKLKPLI
jgi:transposase